MNESYQILQIDPQTWRIEDGFVRGFLLAGTEKALLIDTCATLKNAREIAEGLTDLPLELCNTHGDPDHIAGNAAFDRVYLHPAEEENYRAFGGPGVLVPVREGDVLDLGGRELEIIELPGHTPGSIALLDRSRRVLISGDPVQDGRIFMFGPGRDLRQYYASLRKLQKRIGDFDALWPAHGSCPLSPDMIGKLIVGTERILAGQVTWTPENHRGEDVRIYDLGCAQMMMKS